ncbi:MAG: hypothetical protein IT209_02940 [Armatimonadetes bacterium]|nr:hypothetical protein [Armatimonadota bacterium]
MSFLDDFRDPPRQYAPVPFWFLNDRLEKERLQWQVREMADKRVFGAVMHARPGLVTPYLTDEWFERIGDILEEARKQGMFTWIYDEYPWMSGMAEYRVPKIHPDFRIRALDRLEKTVVGPGSVTWDFGPDLPEGAAEVVGAVVCPLSPQAANDSANNTSLPVLGAGQDVSHLIENRCLSLEAPDGPFLISVFYERLSYNPYGDGFGRDAVSDLMHPEAMRCFIDLTHREYQRRFPDYFGPVITASFLDEPPADTPGWSRRFLDEFTQRKGYDLRPFLPLLWHDAGRMSAQARLDYQDVLGQLYEESFFGQIEQWCEGAGIASSGHLLLEETLVFHARFMGDYFRSMRRMHYPGIDYIFPGDIPAVTCRVAASVASLYGRERVMSECFALTGWEFTFEHMKKMTDWQLVHGVNCLVPHAFFYSSREDEPWEDIPSDLGFRWFDCPPSMFYQQPYWDYYGVYADYLRRLQWLNSQGEHVTDIAVYYPIETVQADFVPTKEYTNAHAFEIPGDWMTADYLWDGSETERTDAHFRCLGNMLRNKGLDYDAVDDDSLLASELEKDAIVVRGRRRYKALILPRTRYLAVDVYRQIERFWEQGGSVIATGCLPEYAVDGLDCDMTIAEISKRIFGLHPQRLEHLQKHGQDISIDTRALYFSRPDTSLAYALREQGFGDFHCDNPSVYSHHRHIEKADVYFLVHHSSEASGPVHVALSGAGVPLLYDPLTASVHPVEYVVQQDKIVCRLFFEALESYFIVIAPAGVAAETGGVRAQVSLMQPACSVSGPWRVRLDRGDEHEMRLCDLPPLPDWESLPKEHTWNDLKPWEELGLLEFSGGATYETVFEWESAVPENAWLDLGEVGMVAEVSVNGVNLGVALWRSYRFNLSGVLRQGRNDLRVRVVNTLANSIQASYGSGKTETRANEGHINRYARYEPGQLRSGLIGPVRVLTL